MRRLGAVVLALALLSGCGSGAAGAVSASRPREKAATAAPPLILRLARGPARPLETSIWYPAGAGRHPVVLFSHGLGGLPAQFTPIISTWVAAGFAVVAPVYPHTNGKVEVDPADIRNQPADAAFVLRSLAGDRHLDLDRVVAAGFSAGATTTLGLLRRGHSPGIVAAISIAGRRPASSFGGAPVPVLFVHGDTDPTVPIGAGRAAYRALPWHKTFVVVPGGRHGDYLNPGNPAYPRISGTILEFLRRAVHNP
ncbi:alpha/beta hydrolase [Actinoplanes sp. KI2]|uniref:alpha/beta hydrolase family protein n=1 Tax=Actinoplanes sp. KI2 TaxID=2983315 RepID=UPI0021D60EE9|nr:alpha/beta hydrolase [Actinoplanes sp. KI2]MCU7722703.1 alpha/beta hydrolase [Actinoplanes sp. KI2]